MWLGAAVLAALFIYNLVRDPQKPAPVSTSPNTENHATNDATEYAVQFKPTEHAAAASTEITGRTRWRLLLKASTIIVRFYTLVQTVMFVLAPPEDIAPLVVESHPLHEATHRRRRALLGRVLPAVTRFANLVQLRLADFPCSTPACLCGDGAVGVPAIQPELFLQNPWQFCSEGSALGPEETSPAAATGPALVLLSGPSAGQAGSHRGGTVGVREVCRPGTVRAGSAGRCRALTFEVSAGKRPCACRKSTNSAARSSHAGWTCSARPAAGSDGYGP